MSKEVVDKAIAALMKGPSIARLETHRITEIIGKINMLKEPLEEIKQRCRKYADPFQPEPETGLVAGPLGSITAQHIIEDCEFLIEDLYTLINDNKETTSDDQVEG